MTASGHDRPELLPPPDTAVKPTRPLPPCPSRSLSPTEQNAEQINNTEVKIVEIASKGSARHFRVDGATTGSEATDAVRKRVAAGMWSLPPWNMLSKVCRPIADGVNAYIVVVDYAQAPPILIKPHAEQIGELQGRVSRLEGHVRFLMDTLLDLQKVVLAVQDREMARLQDRLDASKGVVKVMNGGLA